MLILWTRLLEISLPYWEYLKKILKKYTLPGNVVSEAGGAEGANSPACWNSRDQTQLSPHEAGTLGLPESSVMLILPEKQRLDIISCHYCRLLVFYCYFLCIIMVFSTIKLQHKYLLLLIYVYSESVLWDKLNFIIFKITDLTNIAMFISSGVIAQWPILGVRHSSCLGKENIYMKCTQNM